MKVAIVGAGHIGGGIARQLAGAGHEVTLCFTRDEAALRALAADIGASVARPAEAVTQAGQCGKIAVVGLATPNAMKPYVDKGCVKSVVLWNPVDLGYAAMYAMRAVADGTLKPGDTSVKAGKLGDLKFINGSEVLLGSPFVFTKANVDKFDF